MLNWENFVIQQEKMQKLRDEITTLLASSVHKMETYQERIDNLQKTVHFFSQTCTIVGSAFNKLEITKKKYSG